MPDTSRALRWLLFAAALTWHLLNVVAPPKIEGGPAKDTAGRDYASYHYASLVAWAGGDPYDKLALDARATTDGTRTQVHPFFYPPPFLAAVAWAPRVDLDTAYWVWYAVNEVALLVAALALLRWWLPLGPAVGPVLFGLIAITSGVAYGHVMGQANALVLALLALGLWAAARGRDAPAGVALGLACMFKMSPALFVWVWLVQRRWTAVSAAIATAAIASVLVLPLVGLSEQIRFYTAILPGFGTGDYNGLEIKVDLFANHSMPNVFAQIWPDGTGSRLSGTAALASQAFSGLVLLGTAALFRRRVDEPFAQAAQATSIATATLFVPVYTYEHHLLWALPGLTVAIAAVVRGRLGVGWAVPLGLATAAIAFPVAPLKALATGPLAGSLPAALAVQEAKFGALWVIFAATTWVAISSTSTGGRGRAADR